MSHNGIKLMSRTYPTSTENIEAMRVGVKIVDFPAGEPQLTLSKQNIRYIKNAKVFDARALGSRFCDFSLLAQASDIINDSEVYLYLPYMPFSRQDRRTEDNTASSLKVFAKTINALNFKGVKTIDAHSDVCEALFDNFKNISNVFLVQEAIGHIGLKEFTFLSPDAGAMKKLYPLIQSLNTAGMSIHTAFASKHRELSNGKITHVSVGSIRDDLPIVIVDDICDGGRTFIEIAKVLPESTEKHLVVTHGIFSNGLDVLFEHFESITTTNSFDQKDDRVSQVRV